jgi:hypothetical protein
MPQAIASMKTIRRFGLILFAGSALFLSVRIAAAELVSIADRANLTPATVVVPPGMSGPERKALLMLVEEAEKTQPGAVADE